jgi:putative heme-binding domain-containing protein
MNFHLSVVFCVCMVLGSPAMQAELNWIWLSHASENGERADFKKKLQLGFNPEKAMLQLTCDNGAELFLNEKKAASNSDWNQPVSVDVTKMLQKGQNDLLVRAINHGGPAGLILRLTLQKPDGSTKVFETGSDWQASPAGQNEWRQAVVVGKYGDHPWGKVLNNASKVENTALTGVQTLPGFESEEIYRVPKIRQGSWVGMTVDPMGRLITCDQNGGFYRGEVTGQEVTFERLRIEYNGKPFTGAHGVLYAFESLYVFINERNDHTHGLYRLRDTNQDDNFDQVRLLQTFRASGEHGVHSIVLSPDQSSLYLVAGNHSKLPPAYASRPLKEAWKEDHLLPRMWDGNGHARGVLAPGGFIMKTDPEAKKLELIAHGFRNQFDVAFNALGDMFSFDADMEWDLGMPWYRPTRVNHVVSGADFGWRSGSGKWPGYYPDSLPTTVDIGVGSPVGVCSGIGAKFPAKYQHAIYINDWTYGTMYAVHLEPKGASYVGIKEEFISGRPLPLTDLLIHPKDGHMYFLVGGRGTQSALHRVTYVGDAPTNQAKAQAKTVEAHLRQGLEKLHSAQSSPQAVEEAWPYLSHEDRHVRHAARVAIERQDTGLWRRKALSETVPLAAVEALVALSRTEEKSFQPAILSALHRLRLDSMGKSLKLATLRAYQLCLIRMGQPSTEMTEALIHALSPLYPSRDNDLDRELCQLLLFLGDPRATGRTVHQLLIAGDAHQPVDNAQKLARNSGYAQAAYATHKSRPNLQQIALAFHLRSITTGWSPELRKSYFSWFPTARAWKGGASFDKFIENVRAEALANVKDATERSRLDQASTVEVSLDAGLTAPEGPGRLWTVEGAVEAFAGASEQVDLKRGKNLFQATACASCHRFAGEGGAVGPDLTGISSRYSIKDLFENIIEPSRIISDQYGSTVVTLKDGSEIIGRLAGETDAYLQMLTNPLLPEETIRIAMEDVADQRAHDISAMPSGLINALNPEEVVDLVSYLLSGGLEQN